MQRDRAGDGRRPTGAVMLSVLPVGDAETAPVLYLARWERSDNLPAPLTSFVGREREVVDVSGALVHHRLVTLIGAPGVGKTRLVCSTRSSSETCRRRIY